MVDDGQLMISMMVDYGDVNRRTCLQNGLNTGTFAKRECVASATNEWDILETNMCDYGFFSDMRGLFSNVSMGLSDSKQDMATNNGGVGQR